MYTYEKRDDHLFVHVTEPLVVESAIFQELGDVCRREGLNKMLVDMQEVHTVLSTFERYQAGVYVATLMGPKIKVAIVAQAAIITYVAETAAVNRYGKLKVCSDMEQARAFLAIGEKDQNTETV